MTLHDFDHTLTFSEIFDIANLSRLLDIGILSNLKRFLGCVPGSDHNVLI